MNPLRRRDVFALIGAAGYVSIGCGGALSGTENGRLPPGSFAITMPRDGWIAELAVADDATVLKGQILGRVEHGEEDLARLRLENQEKLLALQGKAKRAQYQATSRKRLELTHDLAKTVRDVMAQRRELIERNYSLGNATTEEKWSVELVLNRAMADVTLTESALTQFDLQADVLDTNLRVAHEALTTERARLDAGLAELTFHAPIDGRIRWGIGAKSFVQRGAIVGVVSR